MNKRLFLILLAVLLLLACVPTPDEPIVVGKDNEAMIAKAQETDAAPSFRSDLKAQLGCPDVYAVSLTDETKKVQITGSAKIELPDADSMPLAYVTAERFSQETVSAFFHALCGDAPMVDFLTETPKSLVAKEIEEKQKTLDALLEEGGYADSDISKLQTQIEMEKAAYRNAPETVELVPNDGTLKTVELTFSGKRRGTVETVQAQGNPLLGDRRQFLARNDARYEDDGAYSYVDADGNTQSFNPNSGSLLMYSRDPHGMLGSSRMGTAILDVTRESETGAAPVLEPFTIGKYANPETILLSVSPKSAREQAEALLKSCGVTDMAVDSVLLYTSRDALYFPENQKLAITREPEIQAYVVRFLRRLNGVPLEGYFGSSQVQLDGVAEAAEWSYETLEIAVDDDGIVSVDWVGPLQIDEIVTDRAALLPFSEICAIFEKMLPIKYTSYGTDWDYRITVGRVRLCLWRILDKNSYTRGILAPVWCFYGSVNSDGIALDRDVPLLIVNAIDGTVIDPYQGY
mgnify:CR=1 FL=1